MNVYEITNPSDKATIVGEELVACIATLVLGQGAYGLLDREDNSVLPIFLLHSADPWLEERGIGGTEGLPAWVDAHLPELADALDSVLLGDFRDRDTYQLGLDLIDDPLKRQKWRDEWHDERRSSLNDFARHAWHLAGHLRKKAQQPCPPKPKSKKSRSSATK